MEVEEAVEAAAPVVPVEAAAGAVVAVVEVEEAVEGAAPVVPVEAAMGAVVAAPAPVPVEIWSLRAAQVLAATLPAGAHVRVRAIELEFAAPLDLILEERTSSARGGWIVPDLHRVSRLAAVDHLLETGIHAHLALVIDHPHDPVYLDAFGDWTWRLQNSALEVDRARVTGDSFFRVVKKICQVSRKVVAAGRTGKKTDIWIGTKLNEILDRILAVKGSMVFLYRPRQA